MQTLLQHCPDAFFPSPRNLWTLTLVREWSVSYTHLDVYKRQVFEQPDFLSRLNGIIHPAVKRYILKSLEEQKNKGRKLCIVEAALFLEEHYQEFCDEVWYIHTDEEIRIQRLMKNRGYTREKSLGIIGNQASEDYFRAHTDFVVENNGNVEKTWKQIDEGVRRNETL